MLPHQGNQLPCVHWLVVHPVQHAVFKGHEITWRCLLVAATGLQQFGYRIFFVQRHQITAQFVIRRMQ